MPIQLANGCSVSYEDHGQGQPIVLLHAFPFSREMWRPQIEALRDEYRVIAPDLRGFGGTDGFDGPPGIDQMADDVHQLLDALGINEPVVLAGLSMGGYVALSFARRHAARLRGLILADTRAEADSPEAREQRERSIEFLRDHSAAEFAEPMLEKLLSETTRTRHPEVVNRAREMAAAQSPQAIAAALAALRDRPDSRAALPGMNVPALVIVGEQDAVTPPAVAETLAAELPRAKLVRIAEAGHLSNLEQPEEFNQAVRQFLREITST